MPCIYEMNIYELWCTCTRLPGWRSRRGGAKRPRGAESLRGMAGRGAADTTCGDTVRITETGRNLFEEKSLELKK